MSKTKVQVVIGGMIYALQGEESEEHIQKVARIINDKYAELENVYGKKLPDPKAQMLVTLNVADEYVKSQELIEEARLEKVETEEQLALCMTELEKCNSENLALQERIKELGLEVMQIREQLAASTHIQHKKDNYKYRGR